MTKRPGSSSVAALALARAMQRSAQRANDPVMLADAIEYERRALEAIRQHLPELPPVMRLAAVQLRLPGL
jgi:hypothetical protein